jgi:hypothetical protein
MLQYSMHDHDHPYRRRDPSLALLEACESLDFMGVVEALDDGGNALCCDDNGNPAWQILLTQRLPKDLDESERAAMFSALFDSGFEPEFNIVSTMVDDIECLDLKESAIVLVRAVESFKDEALSQRCLDLLHHQHPWFSALLANQQAADLSDATPMRASRPTSRL